MLKFCVGAQVAGLVCLLFIRVEVASSGFKCDRTPEDITAPSRENFGLYLIEISGNPEAYVAGEQYTIFLRATNKTEKFTSFILAVEGSKSIGSLQLYGDALTKFSERCPNSIIETDSLPKSDIQVLWLAPESGSGCVSFRAAVVVSNQVWYNADGPLSKKLCEESQDSQDTQPNVLQHCCACDEAKYESDHIRTIIKARGISYPNITGKTFAVFRVDNKHHLMSIVSMIDPSPDWIVGVSSLELCMKNCSWTESKILNLYPWDVGTDDGITYISPNQPSSPRQPIRRIKSTSPNDPRSPFYDPSGEEMKPLARLYLSRQRLYEKVCDPTLIEEQEFDTNCDTEDWSEWSPCSATCGRGVKYRQRRYRNDESKYVCHKKLTERASCEAVQKYCPHSVHREIEDPMCVLGPWSEWSSCSVTCGKGIMTRDRKYKNRLAAKSCAATKTNPPKLQENLECYGEAKCDDFEEALLNNCPEKAWTEWSPCSATCGKGFKVRFLLSLDLVNKKGTYWPFDVNYDFEDDDPCNNHKIKETVECFRKACDEEPKYENAYACSLPKDVGACKSNVDRWHFDTIKGNCEIFSYSGCDGNLNNFKTLEQCQTVCEAFRKELLANRTAHKKQLDAQVSGVLSYNIQNDAINGNKCVSALQIYGQIQLKNTTGAIDCKVTKWSGWGKCITSEICGPGHRIKHRHIKVHPKNGGRPCPSSLAKKKKCHIPCNYKKERVDCRMSSWSEWSKCDKNMCLFGVHQERFRKILVYPKNGGTHCPGKVDKRPCLCHSF